MTDAPNPPYVGPAAHTSSGSNRPPINRVVIHCTVSPCVTGGARSVAAYFRSAGAGGSAHYVVDPAETLQVVYDNVIAWHAPPNSNSLGIELCDPQTGSTGRWDDDSHVAMLHRAAALTAGLCAAYNVPIRKLTASDLLDHKRGVCGHVDVSQAWHESTHTDPGTGFPWAVFMRMVRQASQGASPPPIDVPPAPEPVPPTTESHGGDHVRAARKAGRDLRDDKGPRRHKAGIAILALLRKFGGSK